MLDTDSNRERQWSKTSKPGPDQQRKRRKSDVGFALGHNERRKKGDGNRTHRANTGTPVTVEDHHLEEYNQQSHSGNGLIVADVQDPRRSSYVASGSGSTAMSVSFLDDERGAYEHVTHQTQTSASPGNNGQSARPISIFRF